MVNEYQLRYALQLRYRILTIGAVLFIGLVLPASVHAASIQSQVNSASAGATLTIPSGNYPERVTLAKSITVTCTGMCVVQGFVITGNNVTIHGFEITYSDSNQFGIHVSGSNCLVENNYIHHTTRDGILIEKSSSNCVIKNNRVVAASQSAMEIRGTNHTIDGNDVSGTIQYPDDWQAALGEDSDADCFRYFGSGHIFKNNYCHDVTYGRQSTGNNKDPHVDFSQTWGDTSRGLAHDITFENNKVMLTGRGGGFTNKAVQMEGGAYNIVFKNNVFRTTLGALFSTSVHDITLVNNTWVGDKTDSGTWGINAENCTKCIVKNNIFAYMINGAGHLRGDTTVIASDNCVWKDGSTRKDPEDIFADPLFVNEAANDYSLQSGSPCAGKGATSNTSSSPTLKSGDVNGDGSVNVIDVGILIDNYGKNISGYPKADLNNDGTINIVDIGIVITNYGK